MENSYSVVGRYIIYEEQSLLLRKHVTHRHIDSKLFEHKKQIKKFEKIVLPSF